MDVSYWNKIAPNYEDEIFNLFRHDKRKVLQRLVRNYSKSATIAADFGSGIGNGLPLLSRFFKQTHAYDLSSKNLKKSRQLHAELDNVDYQRADFSTFRLPKNKYQFALSVCMLIMPSLKVRQKILSNMLASIKRDGTLVLVVPSLESACYVNAKLIEWNLADGLSAKAAVNHGFDPPSIISAADMRQGVLPIEGVRTKHFGREELLDFIGNDVTEKKVVKIEYDWDSVFSALPKKMQTHLPWDWAIIITR